VSHAFTGSWHAAATRWDGESDLELASRAQERAGKFGPGTDTQSCESSLVVLWDAWESLNFTVAFIAVMTTIRSEINPALARLTGALRAPNADIAFRPGN
jgi:hypothetical protein